MKATSCFAFGCNHNAKDKCKLFRFPTDRRRRRKWITLCRRADRECTANDRLCSCHFHDWKKKNGPTIFPYLKSEILNPDELKERRDKRDTPASSVALAEPGAGDAQETACIQTTGTSDTAPAQTVETPDTMSIPTIAMPDTMSIQMTEATVAAATLAATAEAEVVAAAAESPDPDEPCQNNHCCVEQAFLTERVSQLEQEAKRQRYKIAHLESQCLRLSIDRITFNSQQQREREGSLQQIVRDLSKKAAKLESQALRMTIDHIRADKDKMLLYTSFTADIFEVLAEILRKRLPLRYHAKWPVTRMSLENQLLLTLMKLKLNCRDLDLAERFQVSRATVTNIVHTLVGALHGLLYDERVVGAHTAAKWKGAMPKCFEEFVASQRTAVHAAAESAQILPPPADLAPLPRAQMERTHARIRSFEILYHIPGMYKSLATQICQLCVCLANLQAPGLRERTEGDVGNDRGHVQPADGSLQPVEGNVQPIEGNVQPMDGQVQPMDSQVQSMDGQVQPMDGQAQLMDANLQPMDANVQPVTSNIQPLTANVQPMDGHVQLLDGNVQLIDANVQPMDANVQPVTSNIQPMTGSVQPMDGHVQPLDSNVQLMDGHVQPMDGDLQPMDALTLLAQTQLQET